jgi:formylglycine-generating enzyme required for sulfatase activity
MMKTFLMAMVVLGVFFGVGACDKERTSATGAAGRKELTVDLGNGVSMKLVQIPAGTFQMGSPEREPPFDEDEHYVTITKPFYMGVYEVTKAQYAQFVRATGYRDPANSQETGDHPVLGVTWHEAKAFSDWLSKQTGKTVVLPTEAQWEYACRAGSKTRFCFADADGSLRDYAWYSDNSGREAHPVGQKKPNAWGLYDMHGNAWEWCSDWFAEKFPALGSDKDPTGPANGRLRVLRGGSCYDDPYDCRSANRGRVRPDERYLRGEFRNSNVIGFRVAVVAEGVD